MFSRCEYCQHQQKITVKQLRRNRGLLKCKRCHKPFDALASLTEKPDHRAVASGPAEDALPWMKPAPLLPPRYWPWINVLLLVVLLGQGVYFEGRKMLTIPTLRALAEQVCQPLHCQPPLYQNLQQWSLSYSDLQPYLAGQYRLTAAISNQALVSQAVPDLKLTLLDFNGEALAQRVFTPRQFGADSEMAAEQSRQIVLWLVAPDLPVGGFNLSLI